MTKINDYLWELPHTPQDDDPEDVSTLIQVFNTPLAEALSAPMQELGYSLRSNDVQIPPDMMVMESMGDLSNVYRANLRFIRYLRPDVIVRVHFEHESWSRHLGGSETHVFFVNLDRFKVVDPATMQVVPAWEGRRHMRMSCMPGGSLEHDGLDQHWSYSSAGQLEGLLTIFLDKFRGPGRDWLEDPSYL